MDYQNFHSYKAALQLWHIADLPSRLLNPSFLLPRAMKQ